MKGKIIKKETKRKKKSNFDLDVNQSFCVFLLDKRDKEKSKKHHESIKHNLILVVCWKYVSKDLLLLLRDS